MTGYGVVARGARGEVSLVECGVIRTSASEPLPRRIREIYDEVDALTPLDDVDVTAAGRLQMRRRVVRARRRRYGAAVRGGPGPLTGTAQAPSGASIPRK